MYCLSVRFLLTLFAYFKKSALLNMTMINKYSRGIFWLIIPTCIILAINKSLLSKRVIQRQWPKSNRTIRSQLQKSIETYRLQLDLFIFFMSIYFTRRLGSLSKPPICPAHFLFPTAETLLDCDLPMVYKDQTPSYLPSGKRLYNGSYQAMAWPPADADWLK